MKIIIMYNTILLILILSIELTLCKTFLNDKNTEYTGINTDVSSLKQIFKSGISSLTLISENKKPALINFKIKNTELLYVLGLFENNLALTNSKIKNIEIETNKSVTLRAESFTMNSINSHGPVKFNDVNQWKLIMHDSFHKNETSLNWNHDKVTKCNNYNIMGGNCQVSSKELIKEIKNLPAHTQIKIEANYHFIGTWDSHTGYLKLDGLNFKRNDPKYVWTNRCKNGKTAPIIKICPILVCKMATPINVTLNHSEASFKMIFGSTLKRSSCEQSYGISDVKVYIR